MPRLLPRKVLDLNRNLFEGECLDEMLTFEQRRKVKLFEPTPGWAPD